MLAAFLALDYERGKLVAINLGKDDEDVRETTVGDEHLFAIENVVCAVRAQLRGRFRVHRVRA